MPPLDLIGRTEVDHPAVQAGVVQDADRAVRLGDVPMFADIIIGWTISTGGPGCGWPCGCPAGSSAEACTSACSRQSGTAKDGTGLEAAQRRTSKPFCAVAKRRSTGQ